jgi:serine/threonine protein kinase
MTMNDDDSLVGKLFAGRFHIESILGAGGMGSVYLARHQVLQRHFALKVIRKELLTDVTISERFRREARAASRIEHPNIIQIADFGQAEDGRLYLAMEYVDGPTLATVLHKEGAFAIPRALLVLDQITDALDAAHSSSVIHRDLKPVNILLTTTFGYPDYVKILDFGLAKILDLQATAGLSAHGTMFGTPEYMSPERCMDTPADHRADIYSLGIIAYELVVGDVPFKGRVVQTLAAHVGDPPPVPSQASGRKDITPELDQIILHCLAKKPEQRFQSAAELADSLSALRQRLGLPRVTGALPPRRMAYLEKAWRAQILDHRSVPAAQAPPAEVDPEDLIEPSTSSPLQSGEYVTLPTDALVEVPPDPPAQDTVIVQRPDAELSDNLPVGGNMQTLEDLAYALRDRGLGVPEITLQLAQLIEVRDQQLQLRSDQKTLQHQLEEEQMTTRIRESRLSQLLHQLEHEASELGDRDPSLSRRLQVRIHAITQRLKDLSEELEGREAALGEQFELSRDSLARMRETVHQHAAELRILLRQHLPQIKERLDPELALLLENAGVQGS